MGKFVDWSGDAETVVSTGKEIKMWNNGEREYVLMNLFEKKKGMELIQSRQEKKVEKAKKMAKKKKGERKF